jgi:fructose-bisphosphate aldolase class I
VTVDVLRHTVPDDVPGIIFLSGGDTPEDATRHLDAINELGKEVPWELSFSFGRALLNKALDAWQGKEENKEAAQQALYDQAALDSLAREGKY